MHHDSRNEAAIKTAKYSGKSHPVWLYHQPEIPRNNSSKAKNSLQKTSNNRVFRLKKFRPRIEALLQVKLSMPGMTVVACFWTWQLWKSVKYTVINQWKLLLIRSIIKSYSRASRMIELQFASLSLIWICSSAYDPKAKKLLPSRVLCGFPRKLVDCHGEILISRRLWWRQPCVSNHRSYQCFEFVAYGLSFDLPNVYSCFQAVCYSTTILTSHQQLEKWPTTNSPMFWILLVSIALLYHDPWIYKKPLPSSKKARPPLRKPVSSWDKGEAAGIHRVYLHRRINRFFQRAWVLFFRNQKGTLTHHQE